MDVPRRRVPATVAAVLALAVLGTAGGPAHASGSRTAFLTFVSYRSHGAPEIGATEIRESGTRLLEDAFRGLGFDVVASRDLEPVLSRRRIRTDADMSPGLLGDLVSEHDVGRLLVARFLVYTDRVLLLVRTLDAVSGELTGADLAEEPMPGGLWTDAESARRDWEGAAGKACRRLAAGWTERPARSDRRAVLVLPVDPVGLGRGPADLATHCLLRSLLASGDWDLPDPAIVAAAMRGSGRDPFSLCDDARQDLRETFSSEIFLIPRLVSFEMAGSTPQALLEEGEDAAEPWVETDARVPLYVSAVVVDGATGRVVSGRGAYLEPADPVGLFGVVRNLAVAQRIQEGTDRIVRALPGREGGG
jgi:hypothetical protein